MFIPDQTPYYQRCSIAGQEFTVSYIPPRKYMQSRSAFIVTTKTSTSITQLAMVAAMNTVNSLAPDMSQEWRQATACNLCSVMERLQDKYDEWLTEALTLD